MLTYLLYLAGLWLICCAALFVGSIISWWIGRTKLRHEQTARRY